MGWASQHIERLKAGETVTFRPHGNSMSPRIKSGQLCTVEPVDPKDIKVGDIVLCHVYGNDYLHLVKAIERPRLCFLIGNNHGNTNGWILGKWVFGRLVSSKE